MIRLSIISFVLFIPFFSNAQSLSASVVGSSGGSFVSAGGSLEWTLGEIMTETYQKTSGFFTQGFHQPTTITVTGLGENLHTEYPILVYPNPFVDRIIIERKSGVLKAQLMDMQGRTLVASELNFNSSQSQIIEIEVEPLPRAMYILKLIDMETSTPYHIKIEKF